MTKPRPMAGTEWSDETTGQFINLQAFNAEFWRKEDARLPDWKTVRRDLPHLLHRPGAEARRLFITHRWDSANHPDPTGWQLRALVELGEHYDYKNESLCFWYDYMSIPQQRDTKEEKKIFSLGLNNIRKLVLNARMYVS